MTKIIKKKNKEFLKFMESRHQSIKLLEAEKKELEERLKICAKSVGDSQKKLENMELQIDVKISLYEKKEVLGRIYNKSIVKMLKQIKSKDDS